MVIPQMTAGQNKALEAMLSGRNVFLTGGAGTGKSTAVELFIEMEKQKHKNILVTAPTGTAADRLHGETIHRCFDAKIGIQKNNGRLTERNQILQATDIIVIDEISMCRFDLFEYVARRIVFENERRDADRIHKMNFPDYNSDLKDNDIQLIVLGDFYQLPPVLTKEDNMELSAVYKYDYGRGYAFKSPYWEMMHFDGIVLTEIVRQENKAFQEILNKIRTGNPEDMAACIDWIDRNSSDFKMTGDDMINLVSTNKKCNEINKIEMDKLHTEKEEYLAEIKGDVRNEDKFAEDSITLKVGCKVMCTVNASDGVYVNGTLGIVRHLGPDYVEILTENEKLITVGKAKKEITKPVVIITTVKEKVKVPVLNEDGSQQTDENGNPLYEMEIRDVKKETIEHEKVGTFTQLPVRIAYAITIHKSQGKTFKKVNLDPYAWDPGQFYTALSRAKSIENVCFMNNIQPKFIQTSTEVRNFMRLIEEKASEDFIGGEDF